MQDAAQPPETGQGLGRVLVWVALAVAAILCVLMYGRALQDDSYISFVYSRNFARGAGFVYNAGEPPVEGYSNFLWTALIGVAMKLGAEPAFLSQALGLACALGTVWLTARVARSLGASAVFAGAAALYFATRQTLIMEAMGGLETCFFGLLVLGGILLRLERSRPVASSLLLACAALTRPEGMLVFALLEGAELLTDRGRWLRELPKRALPFVAVVGAHVAWRYATYGDLVPNTFHVKVEPSADILKLGATYCLRAFLLFGPVFLLLPYLVAWKAERRTRLLTCLLISTVYFAYIANVGGDFKPTFRYLLPVMPLWSALAAAALTWLFRRAKTPKLATATWVVALALAVTHLVVEYGFHRSWTPETERSHQRLVAAGKQLNRILPEDASIAVCNAGRIPYHADRKTIDMLGLNDAHIAREPVKDTAADMIGHMKGDGRYVLDQEPDAILFLALDLSARPLASASGWREQVRFAAFGTSEKEIDQDIRFDRDYVLVSQPLVDVPGYLNFFVRRETLPRLKADQLVR